MAGGAGLVVHVLIGVSLPLAFLVLVAIGSCVWAYVLSRLRQPVRRGLAQRAVIGAIAGLIATVAYDLSRYGTVALFHMSFQPFHILSVFGELFLGSGHDPTVTFVVGLAYHLSNGTFFGVAYALVFRTPTWWTGMLWGVGLELCMATLYPAWLRIQMLGEFLQVSAVGHIVYGSILGLVASVGVRRLSRLASARSEVEHP